MRRLRSLVRASRGVAAVEFALMSVFMFGVIVVALDFGVYAQQKLRLGSAVEQAAIIAFNTQVTTNIEGLRTYLQTAAGTTATPTVEISCNGTAACGNGTCSCLTAAGGFTIMGSCNAPCASGALSGNYMKIAASTVYRSMVVPDRYLSGRSISQAAVVRLQ